MKLTLNVGCGNRTYTEYPDGYKCINYDIRSELKNVDVVGDVQDLSIYSNEYFDYILASDIIEHFPISKTANILKEWGRVLKKNGILEIRCPNLESICKAYINGRNDAKLTSWLLYGGQDYKFNFHYVGFDAEWIIKILNNHGFDVIEYKDVGTNMNIKSRKK